MGVVSNTEAAVLGDAAAAHPEELHSALEKSLKQQQKDYTEEQDTTKVFVSDDEQDSSDEILPDDLLSDEDGIAIRMNENMTYAADALMASELAKLSQQERERVLFDLHGISGPTKESPELVVKSQSELLCELERLLRDEPTLTKAYQMALTQSERYVQNEEFLLKFLRADRFDVSMTAMRLVKHFQVKLDLFGPDKLTRDILQDDLDTDTAGAMYDGYKQVLPLRDRAGRLVFIDMIHFTADEDTRSIDSRLRRKFYSAMVAAEDLETQQNGCILIPYAVDAPYVRYEFTFMNAILKVMDGLPIRIEAVHFCHNSNWTFAPKIALFRLASTVNSALRSKVHYGSHAECLFQLQTFGVPVSCMPLDASGKPTGNQNAQLWQQRKEYERQLVGSTQQNNKAKEEEVDAQSTHGAAILCPGRFDILLGRGKGFHDNLGNLRLRNLVIDYMPKYKTDSTRDEKKQITKDIVAQMQQVGGRFLKQSETGWIEVSHDEARLKVSHLFRNLKNTSKTILPPDATESKLVSKQNTATTTSGNQVQESKVESLSAKRTRGQTFGRGFYTLE